MALNATPPLSMMALITGYMPARLVFLAAELGIADLIADGATMSWHDEPALMLVT